MQDKDFEGRMFPLADIFVNYWLQWILGIIAAGIALWAKRYIKLEKKTIQDKQKERMQELRTEVKDEITKELNEQVEKLSNEDAKIYQEIEIMSEKVEIVGSGVLAIQGQVFKEECRRLLDENHHITLDEFEQLQQDHEVYNNLGGNHKGDELFEAAKTKYINNQ